MVTYREKEVFDFYFDENGNIHFTETIVIETED